MIMIGLIVSIVSLAFGFFVLVAAAGHPTIGDGNVGAALFVAGAGFVGGIIAAIFSAFT